jgi:aerobic carbon-monoxide dehydrogenase small subunit
VQIEFRVNGEPAVADVEPRTSLLDTLRDELGLTGTHVGCEHGVCGACNVLMDGQVVRSCLVLAVQARGRDVSTVEGLESPTGELSPLQESFCKHHAMQCGYCTPGILMALTGCLRENPTPSQDELSEALSGTMCRCTGYQQIVDAASEVVEQNRTAGVSTRG